VDVANPGKRADPCLNYRFRVILDNLATAEFSEVSGLEMSIKYDEIREGGENAFVHRLPTRVEYGNLTLKRGYDSRGELFRWCFGKFKRRKVTVQLIDDATRQPVRNATWVFDAAYPVKWTGPSLKASENGIAIESLELAHQGLVPNIS
jgi:phage tail-like protein